MRCSNIVPASPVMKERQAQMKILTTHGQIAVVWSTIALSTMPRVKLAISSSATEFNRNEKNIHPRVRF